MLLFFVWRLNLDYGRVGAELLGANWWALGLSVGLAFPLIALKGWRWQVILADLNIRLSFDRAYRLYALGLSAGSLTPGQAGDFVKAWYLQRAGHSLGAGFVSVVLDRLFDLAALLLLATSGLIVLGADFASLLPGVLSLSAGIALALVVLAVPPLRNRLLSFALRFLLRKKARQTSSGELDQAERSLGLGGLSLVGSLTVLATALVLVRVWLLALALGINLGPTQVIAASSLASVVSLLPLSVAGIGARDLVLIAILAKLGYGAEKAVSLATFMLLLQLVNLVAGYLVWATRRREPSLAASVPPGETNSNAGVY